MKKKIQNRIATPSVITQLSPYLASSPLSWQPAFSHVVFCSAAQRAFALSRSHPRPHISGQPGCTEPAREKKEIKSLLCNLCCFACCSVALSVFFHLTPSCVLFFSCLASEQRQVKCRVCWAQHKERTRQPDTTWDITIIVATID